LAPVIVGSFFLICYFKTLSFKHFFKKYSGTRFALNRSQNNAKALNHTPEVIIMETSLITVFASLSIVLGLMVGFGTLSVVRGVFTFLMFIGLALSGILNTAGVNMILSYFLGQLIIMGTTYLFLRTMYPDALVKVRKEFQTGPASCH
jgi:hypothetical protein